MRSAKVILKAALQKLTLISRFQLLNVDKRNPRKKSTRSFYPERGRGHTVHKVHTVLCRRLGKQIDLTPKGQKIF